MGCLQLAAAVCCGGSLKPIPAGDASRPDKTDMNEEEIMDIKNKALRALLSLQRFSWEQGCAVQASMEAGDWLLTEQLLRSSIYRAGAMIS